MFVCSCFLASHKPFAIEYIQAPKMVPNEQLDHFIMLPFYSVNKQISFWAREVIALSFQRQLGASSQFLCAIECR